MLLRLRDNWLYKLLALGFAVALHFYATNLLNPPQSRVLPVAVTPHNLPSDLLWSPKTAPQVSVTLTGPADQLNRVPDSAVTASVDVAGALPGKPVLLPVRTRVATGEPGVSVEAQPQYVSITLTAKSARRLPIVASAPAAPPAGYTFRAPVVTPRRARVEGGRDAVESVRQLVVRVDAPGAIGTIDEDGPIVALDAQNNPVPDVTITPATATVRIEMTKVPAAKTLIVSPSVTGSPPFPARITGIDVSPPTVTVSGRPEQLARSSTVSTAPIDVSGATSDVTRQVPLATPAGLTVIGAPTITVTVHISSPPAAPSPPPNSPTPVVGSPAVTPPGPQ